MNTKEAITLLSEYLADDFYFHPAFFSELSSLIKHELKGKEKRFFRLFITQLNNIRSFGILIDTVDSNEKIKGMDGHYYSIHLKQKEFNIRFLIYLSDHSVPYFLSAFYEREGKHFTDYTKYLAILTQRLAQLQEEQNE